MKKCFSCLRRLKFLTSKKDTRKWLTFLDNFCTANSQNLGWCELFIDNEQLIRQHDNLSQELQREIKSTNISSQILRMIGKEYKSQTNVFKFCIDLFSSYVKLKYQEIINPSKNTVKKLVTDYQQFINLMKDLMVIYYCLQQREIHGEDLFYKLSLPNLTVSFLFQNQEFTTTINKVIKNCYKEYIEKIAFHLQKYSSYAIEQYNIHQGFLLNLDTFKLFGLKSSKNQSFQKSYAGSIQIVKEIIRAQTPMEKLQLCQSLIKQIQSSILNFYKNHEIKAQTLELDSDNLRLILLKIIVQANQSNFASHIELIKHFTYKTSQNITNSTALNQKNNRLDGLSLIINSLDMLEKGNIRRQKKNNLIQFMDDQYQFQESTNAKSYFDEVSNFQL